MTSTRAMVRAAEERGIAIEDLLGEAGITRALLDDPDARLPGPVVLALWNALRERTADPALQLVAPTSLPFGAYRVIDYLVGASATVGEGIRRFASFFGLIADGVRLGVEEVGEERHLRFTTQEGGPVPPVYVDYVFAALVGRIRMRIRPDLEVRRLELRRSEPPWADVYVSIFGAPVRFLAAADGLCFARGEWERPLDGADAPLAGLLEEHARMLSRRSPRTSLGFRAEVEKAIASAPPEGGSAARVARTLHVSVRTLQRKLVEEGTSFREVADGVRGRLAQDYLADPAVSIAEVTFLLGFSDPSSFNRAFRRWTGMSPGRWRSERR